MKIFQQLPVLALAGLSLVAAAPARCPQQVNGTALDGFEMDTMTTSLDGCCNFCNDYADCTGYTYTASDSTCHIMSGAIKGNHAQAGAVSAVMGPKTPAPTPALPARCQQQKVGMALIGIEMDTTKVSLEQCCNFCNDYADCKGYTYTFSDSTCHIMSTVFGENPAANVASAVMPAKTVAPTPTPTRAPTTAPPTTAPSVCSA